MIDLERYNREKDGYTELWKAPVAIQFGAVFEAVTGSLEEPLYSLGVVLDIDRGGQFRGGILLRDQIDPETGETLPEFVGGGGDWYRIHILRMTGEIMSLEQVLEGIRQSFLEPPSPEDPYWIKYRGYIEEWISKGSRILPGVSKD